MSTFKFHVQSTLLIIVLSLVASACTNASKPITDDSAVVTETAIPATNTPIVTSTLTPTAAPTVPPTPFPTPTPNIRPLDDETLSFLDGREITEYQQLDDGTWVTFVEGNPLLVDLGSGWQVIVGNNLLEHPQYYFVDSNKVYSLGATEINEITTVDNAKGLVRLENDVVPVMDENGTVGFINPKTGEYMSWDLTVQGRMIEPSQRVEEMSNNRVAVMKHPTMDGVEIVTHWHNDVTDQDANFDPAILTYLWQKAIDQLPNGDESGTKQLYVYDYTRRSGPQNWPEIRKIDVAANANLVVVYGMGDEFAEGFNFPIKNVASGGGLSIGEEREGVATTIVLYSQILESYINKPDAATAGTIVLPLAYFGVYDDEQWQDVLFSRTNSTHNVNVGVFMDIWRQNPYAVWPIFERTN